MEAVEFATLEWVDWFNNRRLLEPIGNIPPAEAEERYYAMMAETAVGRDSNKIASGNPGAGHFFPILNLKQYVEVSDQIAQNFPQEHNLV